MVDVVLERTLKTKCYKIQADISIFERTDYILAVLVYVDEQRGATVESLSEKLFANYDTISRNLLELCKDEGLVEEDGLRYVLTESGKSAIKYGRTPVPYEGIWKIHLADDPLILPEYRLLSIEQAHDIEWEDGRPVYDQPDPEELTSDVLDLKKKILQPSFGKNINTVRINEIETYGKEIRQDLDICARWKMEEKKSTLMLVAATKNAIESTNSAFDLLGVKKTMSIGEINDRVRNMIIKNTLPKKNNSKKVEEIEKAAEQIRSNYDVISNEHRSGSTGERSVHPSSDITHDEIWGMISKRFHCKWDPKRRCLLAEYNSVKPNERLDMKVRLKAVNLEIGKLGKFRTREMNVPIYPATYNDAKKWAVDQLCKKMESEYMTRERYQKLAKLVAGRFPDFKIEFQKRTAHVPSEKTPLFWHIQAMEDWNL